MVQIDYGCSRHGLIQGQEVSSSDSVRPAYAGKRHTDSIHNVLERVACIDIYTEYNRRIVH